MYIDRAQGIGAEGGKGRLGGGVEFWVSIVPWIQHFWGENAALGHLILCAGLEFGHQNKIVHGDG